MQRQIYSASTISWRWKRTAALLKLLAWLSSGNPLNIAAQVEQAARQVLREYKASEGMWPSGWIPGRLEAARAKFAEVLEHEVGNL